MKPEQPSDRLENLIEESLRSEPFLATPTGFWGRVTRAVESDLRRRRTRRAWTLRSTATLFAFGVALFCAYTLIGSSGLIDSTMASIPGAYGLIDQTRHAIDNSSLFLMLAALLLPLGLFIGIMRELRFHQQGLLI